MIACHCMHCRRPSNPRWWLCCRALYGLLMLLPQSAAFKTLHARLHSVPTLALLQLEQSGAAGKGSRFSGKRGDAQPSSSFNQHLDYEALLALFRRRQVSSLGPRQVGVMCLPLIWVPPLQEEHVEAEERRKGNIDIGEGSTAGGFLCVAHQSC